MAIAPEVRHATMMSGALAVIGWVGVSALDGLGGRCCGGCGAMPMISRSIPKARRAWPPGSRGMRWYRCCRSSRY
ncbi:hypothetical protein ACFSTD_03720 [Novosphingobium colocasiae]